MENPHDECQQGGRQHEIERQEKQDVVPGKPDGDTERRDHEKRDRSPGWKAVEGEGRREQGGCSKRGGGEPGCRGERRLEVSSRHERKPEQDLGGGEHREPWDDDPLAPAEEGCGGGGPTDGGGELHRGTLDRHPRNCRWSIDNFHTFGWPVSESTPICGSNI